MLVDYFDEMTTQSIMGPGLSWRLWLPPTNNHKWVDCGYSWRHGGVVMGCRVCDAQIVVHPERGPYAGRWLVPGPDGKWYVRPCPGAAQGVRR